VTTVVRAGDTVRRPPSPNAAFVHDLLRFLEARGWEEAPRFLGVDAHGREVLSYLEGHVPWAPGADQAARVAADDNLVEVAGLVRQLHDLTAGTPLAGPAEVVCHNDLSPRNTVYRDTGHGPRPVAFLDWDLAAPGARLHDLAHVCWQFLDLGPSISDLPEAARRLRLLCDSYGLADRTRLVETILWWQDRCWRGIESGAAAGNPAMARLRDHGAVAGVQAAYAWVAGHRAELEAALT
jgi:aminoglycoside phosphotransferase (APT) family kinase protein